VRAVLRFLSFVLAGALVLLGVLVVVEVVRAALDYRPGTLQYDDLGRVLRRNSWDSTGVIVTGIILCVVGLLLLVLGLRRGRPRVLPLRTETPDVEVVTTRRSLQQALSQSLHEIDGVSAARVKVGRRAAKVTVASQLRTPEGLDERVRQHVESRLDGIGLAAPPAVKVSVASREVGP
jgi:hypothetical protein